VGLRTGSSADFSIVDGEGRLIGTVDENRAYSLVHPGALYLHQGQQYRVTILDLDDRAAIVQPSNADEYTQARTDTDIRIITTDDSSRVGRAVLSLGAVEVTEQVVAFQRKHLFTGEVLGIQDLDLPPTRLVTRAFWYTVGDDVLSAAGLVPARVPGTVHAAEHAGIGILPLFTICDRWDVGGVSTNWQPQTGMATIVIYDGYPGGAGIAELGYGAADRHLAATLEVLLSCRCEQGCPSCVQSPKCGNLNDMLDKDGALTLLRRMLARG
jgi:DEAD/DEAH box helicase domain-containing protein